MISLTKIGEEIYQNWVPETEHEGVKVDAHWMSEEWQVKSYAYQYCKNYLLAESANVLILTGREIRPVGLLQMAQEQRENAVKVCDFEVNQAKWSKTEEAFEQWVCLWLADPFHFEH